MAAVPNTIVVDHVFVLCAEGAPEADLLVRAGLKEGQPNSHPGQGTACRRFFFRNLYLELLWVCDPIEAAHESTRPIGLLERWNGRAATTCPFGIFLRSPQRLESLPFPSWPYRPSYLPPGAAIDVAEKTPLHEPQIFHLAGPVPADPARGLGHTVPAARVVEARVGAPNGLPVSPAGRWLAESGLVSFFTTTAWLLELNFSMTPTTTLDFRPRLPVVINYEAER